MPGYRRGRSHGFTGKNLRPRRSVPNARTRLPCLKCKSGRPPEGTARDSLEFGGGQFCGDGPEFGVPVRHYKVYAGWAAERLGRLKLNGHVLSRSPLSTLVELELLRLGVEGKAAGWRTLKVVAATRRSVSVERLDGLIARALEQSQTLEDLRVRTAADVLVLSAAE